jgi:membrane fusion protein (multidrug efflux system)
VRDEKTTEEKPMESAARETREKPLRPAAPAAEEEPKAAKPRSRVRRIVLFGLLGLGVLIGSIFGIRTIAFYRHHVETDDAQLEAHIAPVLPKIAGYVTEVAVRDNERVRAGQLLVRIDDRDYRSRVETARASLANAEAAVAVALANAQAARTESSRAGLDLERYARLREKEEVSQQQYDASKAAAEASVARTDAGKRSTEAARAQVAQRKADLEYAELQLSYATVTAPVDGAVSRKNVEIGQYVQAGQPLLAIVSGEEVWVVANFKETQLKKMRVGQAVDVEVDAYPGTTFRGRVESFAAATGAKFALLPPDNATGNFTKVVQRVPVKIVLTEPARADKPLRPGMSVNAIVSVD